MAVKRVGRGTCLVHPISPEPWPRSVAKARKRSNGSIRPGKRISGSPKISQSDQGL